jgi:6-phosphofructokinase 1
MPKNAFYAQSGGVSAVINASACGVIETARKHRKHIGRVYAGRDGIIGALTEDLIDTSKESRQAIAALRHTPGGAFGSCRYKLKGLEENRAQYERLIEVFKAHDIGYFFYNGGGDSMDTANKVSKVGRTLGYPLTCIGVPKTVDNDLPITDNSPGFGSVAKYIAVSIREAGLDVLSMARTSTKIFVLEVMGRHAGWIAASAGLAGRKPDEPPHIILFPEIAFDEPAFLVRVKETVDRYGYCVVAVSEGVRNADGKFLRYGTRDAFGHAQPAAGQVVAETKAPGYKFHWALADICSAPRAHRFADRRAAGLCGRQSRGRARSQGRECDDAHHRAGLSEAVPLAGWRGKAREDREPGKKDAAQLHHGRWLRHHGSLSPLPRAFDPG